MAAELFDVFSVQYKLKRNTDDIKITLRNEIGETICDELNGIYLFDYYVPDPATNCYIHSEDLKGGHVKERRGYYTENKDDCTANYWRFRSPHTTVTTTGICFANAAPGCLWKEMSCNIVRVGDSCEKGTIVIKSHIQTNLKPARR